MSQHKGSVLITGANGGLATSIISQILSSSLGKEYYGIYTVRQPQSASSLQETLKNNPSHKNEIIRLELSSLASVREAAADINKRVASGAIPRIRALILNAAFQDSTSLTMTDDGFDMSFQVNHLSQFLFTLLLLESLDQNHGRIVVVGSWSHDVENPRNEIGAVAGAYNGLKELYTTTEPLARGKWSTPAEDPSLKAGYRRYGATKLCEIMFMNELQARLSRDPVLSNISVLGVDPGGMGTGLLRRQGWVNRVFITKLVPIFASVATHIQPNGVLRPTSKSATDVLRAAFDTEILGEYPKGVYMDGSAKSETGAEAKDERKRAMLWKDSVQYAELREGETVLKEWK